MCNTLWRQETERFWIEQILNILFHIINVIYLPAQFVVHFLHANDSMIQSREVPVDSVVCLWAPPKRGKLFPFSIKIRASANFKLRINKNRSKASIMLFPRLQICSHGLISVECMTRPKFAGRSSERTIPYYIRTRNLWTRKNLQGSHPQTRRQAQDKMK
jgi:hypothetical protein